MGHVTVYGECFHDSNESNYSNPTANYVHNFMCVLRTVFRGNVRELRLTTASKKWHIIVMIIALYFLITPDL